MPSYRGIPQLEIASSIRDARALLSAYTSGPALDAHLAKVNEAAIDAIADASDDTALASAIKDSNIEAHMLAIADLLRFHAEADTDHKGLAIYKTLASWGALSGARPLSYNNLDDEIAAFIAAQPPEVLITAQFNAAAVKTQVASLSPFQRYVIEIDGMREGFMPAAHPAIEAMCNEMTRTFAGNEEFKRVMLGALSADADAPHGIVFVASAPIALKVADMYPMFTIIALNGAVIPPAAKRSADSSTPSP